jgi:hypothetical protein
VACLALGAGCSLAFGKGGGEDGRAAARPEPELHVGVAPVVYWGAGRDRHLSLALENGANRTIAVGAPDPANVSVAVFPGPDDVRACGIEAHPSAAPTHVVEIPPGGSLEFRVDLSAACAGLSPGDYRFEVDYHAPPVQGGETFAGALAKRHGELRVEGSEAAATVAPDHEPSPRAGRTPPRR